MGLSIALDPLSYSTEDFAAQVFAADPIVILIDDSGGCILRFLAAPGAWMLQRDITTTPLGKAHPDWPKQIMRAIKEGRIQIGMTREQVAWAHGFPPQPGTIEQLNRLDVWDYKMPPPGGDIVTFRNNRVVKYEPAHMMP